MGLYSELPTAEAVEQAQKLMVIAYQLPPITPGGRALMLVAITLVLLIIDVIVVGLRVWTRAWHLRKSRAWGWDDSLALIAFVSLPHCLTSTA